MRDAPAVGIAVAAGVVVCAIALGPLGYGLLAIGAAGVVLHDLLTTTADPPPHRGWPLVGVFLAAAGPSLLFGLFALAIVVLMLGFGTFTDGGPLAAAAAFGALFVVNAWCYGRCLALPSRSTRALLAWTLPLVVAAPAMPEEPGGAAFIGVFVVGSAVAQAALVLRAAPLRATRSAAALVALAVALLLLRHA